MDSASILSKREIIILEIHPRDLTYDLEKTIKDKIDSTYLYKVLQGSMLISYDIVKNAGNKTIYPRAPIYEDIALPVILDCKYKFYKNGDVISGKLYIDNNSKKICIKTNELLCNIIDDGKIVNIDAKLSWMCPNNKILHNGEQATAEIKEIMPSATIMNIFVCSGVFICS